MSGSRDQFESGLRAMLEAREAELENERLRKSRIFSIFLGAVGLVILVTFLSVYVANRTRPEDQPLPAVPLASPVKPPADASADLSAFTKQSGDSTTKEDLNFAIQLLDFVNPSEAKPSAPVGGKAER